MWFYGQMKGMSMGEVKKEIDSLLQDVGLQHKRHEQTKNLSGRLANINSMYMKPLSVMEFSPR